MKRKLTAKLIEALPPGSKVQDTGVDVPGMLCSLRLEVGRAKDGAAPLRTWYLYYRSPATRRRRNKTLGHYPADGRRPGQHELGLKEARAKALTLAGQLASGRDPFGSSRGQGEESTTVRACAELYIRYLAEEEHGVPRRRGWKQQEYLINSKVLPAWGDRDILDITADDALDLLSRIEPRAPTVAYQLCSHLRMMWKILPRKLRVRELVLNPFVGLDVGSPGRPRVVFLSPDQICTVWQALESEIDDGIAAGDSDRAVRAAAVELAILTGLRRGEVLKSRFSELAVITEADARPHGLRRSLDASSVCGEWLRIPALRFDEAGGYIGSTKGSKKPQPKDVFLGTAAGRTWLGRLRAAHHAGSLHTDWMFPVPKTGRWRKDFDHAVWRRFQSLTGIPNLRWHLLRHTVATLLDEIGYDLGDVGRVLGHAVVESSRAAKTTTGYIHRRRLASMARIAPIFADWHDYLLELLEPAAGGREDGGRD